MFTRLASDIADPVERLRVIAAQTTVAKEHHNTISASMLQDWAQFAPANTVGLAVRLAARTRLMDRGPVIHNLVISNVPGPPMPIYFAGARITGFFPFGPVFHKLLDAGIYLAPSAYEVGFLSAAHTREHVDTLVREMRAALG